MADAPGVSRLAGEVDLRFGLAGNERTSLVRRYRTGHFHLGKAYDDGRQLVVQVVNTTAGIFENDTLHSHFACDSGARACVLSPSSNQVYAMPGSGAASSRQHIEVRSGGSLTVLPRWLVPHRGSRFEQVTTIELEPKARLFYLEPVSAGRNSSGEFLETESLSCRVDIRAGGRLILREHLLIGNRANRWILERRGERFPYLATAYVAFPGAAGFIERDLAGIAGTAGHSTRAGVTALTDELAVIRLLGKNCTEITATLKALYAALRDEVPISPVMGRI